MEKGDKPRIFSKLGCLFIRGQSVDDVKRRRRRRRRRRKRRRRNISSLRGFI
jgi:hypothetical protein